MIDLHSHILPGLDDGAADLAEALAMARMAAEDGIRVMACTPHIVPGLYENNGSIIRTALEALQEKIREEGIDLKLLVGADVHIAPNLPEKLATKEVPTLGDSRYFLLEPPHHVLPPRLDQLVERLIAARFLPILTHPERLTWIASHYDVIASVNKKGCFMQITAGSLTGGFGKTARYYAERMLDEGRVDILATDCHNTKGRPPILSQARHIVEERLDAAEAKLMVFDRPAQIVLNKPLTPVGSQKSVSRSPAKRSSSVTAFVSRLLKRTDS